jgi:hypothetical protein
MVSVAHVQNTPSTSALRAYAQGERTSIPFALSEVEAMPALRFEHRAG